MLPAHTRDLASDELEQLFRDLAARPERWRQLVDHRPDERTYAELHRDQHVAVWLICWMNDHDTGYHDHDLSAGAVALCAELTSDRPRHVVATIAEDAPGALAQHLDGRVYALLPGGGDPPETVLGRARGLAERLRRHGLVGLSSFYADPSELGRSIQEAELVLDVVRRSGAPIEQDIGTGTYRLLFRVLA